MITYVGNNGLDASFEYSEINVISYLFEALHLPVNHNVLCEDAPPRIHYSASGPLLAEWAATLRAAIVEKSSLAQSIQRSEFNGDWDQFAAVVLRFAEFLETCGGYRA